MSHQCHGHNMFINHHIVIILSNQKILNGDREKVLVFHLGSNLRYVIFKLTNQCYWKLFDIHTSIQHRGIPTFILNFPGALVSLILTIVQLFFA